VKYLPLFHHFKANYQFPKHIIVLVKIVANASLIKTKQSCYYLNLFHESNYFRIYVGFTHVGLNVSAYTLLVSCEDSRNSRSV
jgi:hypothetical protein